MHSNILYLNITQSGLDPTFTQAPPVQFVPFENLSIRWNNCLSVCWNHIGKIPQL